jgi:hypothetical protein
VLIAGHKRYAALAQLGHTEIRAEVRHDGEHEASERAAENITSCRRRHETINADHDAARSSNTSCACETSGYRSRLTTSG